MKNKSELMLCIKCKRKAVIVSYLEDMRYRYKCCECGQYFEFNGTSRLEAEVIWKYFICRDERQLVR